MVPSGDGKPTNVESVKGLFTSRWPNSVWRANSASRWTGCVFIDSTVKSRLSTSLTAPCRGDTLP